MDPEVVCVAQTIYYEARGEPFKGKIAVAHVVLNRNNHPNFPAGFCAVVNQKGQFSWTSGKRKKVIQYYDLALEVVQGKYDHLNINALYFHNKTVTPHWNKRKVATIGNHVFYK